MNLPAAYVPALPIPLRWSLMIYPTSFLERWRIIFKNMPSRRASVDYCLYGRKTETVGFHFQNVKQQTGRWDCDGAGGQYRRRNH